MNELLMTVYHEGFTLYIAQSGTDVESAICR